MMSAQDGFGDTEVIIQHTDNGEDDGDGDATTLFQSVWRQSPDLIAKTFQWEQEHWIDIVKHPPFSWNPWQYGNNDLYCWE